MQESLRKGDIEARSPWKCGSDSASDCEDADPQKQER